MNPDPRSTCGPYKPLKERYKRQAEFGEFTNHDTIGMIAIHQSGSIAAGTSSNGAKFKIPGYLSFKFTYVINIKVYVYLRVRV